MKKPISAAALWGGLLGLMAAGGGAVAATQPDAAGLVRDVQQSEAWFGKLNSFHLRAESRWSSMPEGREARRIEIAKKFPDREPTTREFPDLAGKLNDTFELSFTPTQLRQEEMGPTMYRLRLWDGARQVDYTHMPDGRELYATLADIQMGPYFLSNLTWGQTANHHFWWIGKEDNPNPALDPDDFMLTGRMNYRGTDCYVLTCSTQAKTLYIGVADHRLYGCKTDAYSSYGADSVAAPKAALDAVRKHFGRDFGNWDEFEKFNATLSANGRHEADRIQNEARRPFCKPYIETWMNNYVEVVPGCWFPMAEGYSLHDLNAPSNPLICTREMRFTVVELNPKLDKSLFVAAEFHEGARVDDWIRDIHYNGKKNRTPAEWQQLINERVANDAAEKAAIDAENALVGKPAPVFPKEAVWINSGRPLTWSDFKGKVVLVDFFAEWCGSCRGDLPRLAELHKQTKETGITIVAIHTPGSVRADIDKMIKDFDLEFPICIDVADGGLGMLNSQYRIDSLPHAFVVDRKGNIAGHGSVAQALGIARKLAGE